MVLVSVAEEVVAVLVTDEVEAVFVALVVVEGVAVRLVEVLCYCSTKIW